ncbi:uncharacterized protein LOC127291686 [Leptopilina boulardi]|uniref:uncharacterized protein LOC127277723 n=1 Tax=Leptopilina boulardi TaxID=63433 RepID=UPI0021F5EBF7|nr:uncharacterized protein LOC127277723 [Leptopilina boulardi]XP_051156187.1 uncharacterized protein LOC127278496 [Leptopilina boulardi]XP_051172361.1 uncharacterized protein LOC127288765 [Leptopilina boulardi]XP_051176875.1 uncharacterized protein LOC127291686 [Leptopilina boulardi]
MYRKEQETLRQIAKASDAIRRKHRLLKMGKEAAETLLKETLQPIVTPLQKLANVTETPFKNVKIEKFKKDINDFSFSTAVDDDEEFDKTLLNSTFLDKNTVYGVRKLANGSFMIGDTPIEFEGSHIKLVGKKNYLKTAGLLELLFKQKPKEALISSDDFLNYKEILIATNAHRKNYSPSESVNISRTSKYTDVIAKLIKSTPKKSGGGGDYIYWDDPNELVDRLRLLIGSQQAGNPSHNNEIMSIIEELREARIIY